MDNESKLMNIIQPSAQMRSKPLETLALETECLFGEVVEVLDHYLDWSYCDLKTDNYQGWIKNENLGYLKPSTHRVISNRSFLFKEKDIKSGFINYLPLGSQIPVKKTEDQWAEVELPKNISNYSLFIPKIHLVKLDHINNDWVSIAEKLIGTPYVWGGRDSIGIDCSALLQLSFQTMGENIPRNTSDQIKLNKEEVEDTSKLERGFVVFWDGHVGIMIDKSYCIHSNAFHMETMIEPLKNIEARIGKALKIMNFNKNT